MWFSKLIAGSVRIRVDSADPSQLLSALNRSGIRLFNIDYVNELTVETTIGICDLQQAESIVKRRGEYLAEQGRTGLIFTLGKILNRPVLVVGILVLFVMTIFLPSRILFIEVEGNRSIPDKLIVEHAAQAGIQFGASRSAVRSERLKNTLLEGIPELQWAGINTRGCVAVITVTERDLELKKTEAAPVSHIVAERDGLIRSITVSQGTPLCQVGQVVEKGQIMVSGYTDCRIAIKAQRAEAEIYAQTSRSMRAVTLTSHRKRSDILARTQRYRIILGKKQINLWKDSGISDTTCVKMYRESYLTLPGGFVLPVGIGTEYLTFYDTSVSQTEDLSACAWLEEWNEKYLRSHMVCGQILNKGISFRQGDGICELSAKYECLEMIGYNRDEELINSYGEKR